MSPPSEATPLLDSDDDLHPHEFLQELDLDHFSDHIHDHPATPKKRVVKHHLTCATTPSGHGHPLHHHLQSPALLLRMQQSFEHGFKTVYSAMHAFFVSARKTATPFSHPITCSYFVVITVFVVAVLTMLVMTSISPTLLLYMNHAGFTDQKHIAPYVTASAFSSAVPIFTNVLFGRIASASGPGNALVVAALFPALGLLIVVLSRNSLILFYIGYAMYASCNSLRTIRVSILTKVVPEHERTTVLATHALMTPIGALIGPLLWILISQYRSSFNITFLTFDRFSITYLIAVGTLLAIAAISVVLLGRIVAIDGTGDATGADVEPDSLGDVVIHRLDGRDSTVNLDEYRNAVFRYFCFIMLGVNISAGIYMTAFQPVLINVFNTSDAKLGVIFEMIAVFAVLPPLLVALLSRHLMDRHILLIGLTSKIFGMLLFLPLFGPVREWQVIVGFLLIVKASIFFSTASMSLFTKLLGSMTTSSLIGLLASGSSVGPALAQILLSKHIVELFGGYWFGLFAVPAVISMGAIALPKFWKRLDPSLEFTRLVTHEAGERRNGAHQ